MVAQRCDGVLVERDVAAAALGLRLRQPWLVVSNRKRLPDRVAALRGGSAASATLRAKRFHRTASASALRMTECAKRTVRGESRASVFTFGRHLVKACSLLRHHRALGVAATSRTRGREAN